MRSLRNTTREEPVHSNKDLHSQKTPLPMQGTWFQCLGQEDCTCHGKTKKPQLVSPNSRACKLQLKPSRLKAALHSKGSHHEKPAHQSTAPPPPIATRESPSTATKNQCSPKKCVNYKNYTWFELHFYWTELP